MSTIKVTNLRGRNGSPNLPDGAVVTGVATATTFDGSLKTTGTPTLGLGVTINSSGLHISGVTTVGVVTGGTFYGDGTNLTGVGETIAPWNYNPDVNDQEVGTETGIGITFNKKILAGSGTVTLKMVNAVSGAAGTTIQSWGISSATFNVTEFTLGALVSPLTVDRTYQVDIPSGFMKDSNDVDYVGTAYTFASQAPVRKLWATGASGQGQLGQNSTSSVSSPVQIPGITWADYKTEACRQTHVMTLKTDGTLWSWGNNNDGCLGLNQASVQHSSPAQIGEDTTWAIATPLISGYTVAVKTNGTLWSWGNNNYGNLGNNATAHMSSPIQIPGTTWRTTDGSIGGGYRWCGAIKTDGTLWMLGGEDDYGELAQNNNANFSSPIQIHGGGTTWNYVGGGNKHGCATKTDGTLWVWGGNGYGQLGQNGPHNTDYSSPVQVPGTTWSKCSGGEYQTVATKTDGTAWAIGYNSDGQLGQNNETNYSSPVQIPGTNWSRLANSDDYVIGLKTDGTLWGIGRNPHGQFGNNNVIRYSSPVQVAGGETGYTSFMTATYTLLANQLDQTP